MHDSNVHSVILWINNSFGWIHHALDSHGRFLPKLLLISLTL